MNSFILDFNLLKEQNLSVNEFLILLSVDNVNIPYVGNRDDLDILQKKGYIKLMINEYKESCFILREKAELLLELVTIEESLKHETSKAISKRSNRVINSDIDQFIQDYRSLWKGLKVGAMGDLQACKDKMYKWMKTNPQYSKEDILKAARLYIRSVDNLKYLQQADYFIYKEDKINKIEQSKLSSMVDEVENPDEGWGSKLN